MCAIMNGISYHGVFRASGATFLVFTDYCRASIRLGALSKLPNIYIFTHDSIGVGEDGPTHEPVETVSSVRVMPQIDVIRPADPEETAGAFAAAAQGLDGKVVGLHEFGLSAPGAEVMKARGIDAKHVVEAAKSL